MTHISRISRFHANHHSEPVTLAVPCEYLILKGFECLTGTSKSISQALSSTSGLWNAASYGIQNSRLVRRLRVSWPGFSNGSSYQKSSDALACIKSLVGSAQGLILCASLCISGYAFKATLSSLSEPDSNSGQYQSAGGAENHYSVFSTNNSNNHLDIGANYYGYPGAFGHALRPVQATNIGSHSLNSDITDKF